MGARKTKRWLVMATVPAAVVMGAIPAGAALAAAQPASKAGGGMHDYVVILRAQNSQFAPRSAARAAAEKSEQAPLVTRLHSLGAKNLGSISLVNGVVTQTTAANAQILAADPAVAEVVPDAEIQGPTPEIAPAGSAAANGTPATAPGLCGTASHPQLNPEALFTTHAVEANQLGADGAGVTVALIADGLNPANPDYQRNAKFATSGSPAGSPVVKEVDFSGDGVGVPTDGVEANIDAGSIVAQGNTAYDLSDYVSAAHPLPAGCDIKIQGTAPGANVLALKAYGEANLTTTSGLLQAISYAVANGAKVLNESFGNNGIPDLSEDAIVQADNAAVAAGVTVVVSSGDAGITNTIGSPATDPNVISVGATDTFRAFAQDNYGGINDPGVGNGRWVNNNISSLSSGGVSQKGTTVDLVAPGDLNWILCDANDAIYLGCTNDNGDGTPVYLSGGTSESSPLTSGAAADVIQAYAGAHGGTDPSPALVKEILMSSATDIDAPATQQGAGLLNVAAAVKLARSIGKNTPGGGVAVSPGQVDVTQNPGTSSTRNVSLTNTSSHAVTVHLATRALTDQIADHSGSFCMQPGTATLSCPANTGTFPIFSGVEETYQNETFSVPHTSRPSRLDFEADFQQTGQTSVLHVALFEPDGTYAGYSEPQGDAGYADIQVANPPAGKWTAIFYTEEDNAPPPAPAGAIGTSGTIQWNANTVQYAKGGPVSTSSLHLAAGQTRSVKLWLTSPSTAGNTSESLVVKSGGSQTTVPVVVRTQIPISKSGGTFHGTLTGGNGRAGVAGQANSYVFNVPHGKKNIAIAVRLANDPVDEVVAYLIDPSGDTVGYSSNVTLDGEGDGVSTTTVNMYHVSPAAGQWTVVLAWQNPVSGLELSEPFSGAVKFNKKLAAGNLPVTGHLKGGKTHTYHVTVHNTGHSPEAFFVDPRLNSTETLPLVNQNTSIDASDLTLPITSPVTNYTWPYYFVPSQTTELVGNATSSAPVTFDMENFNGDPDIAATSSGDSASATVSGPELTPGFWSIFPSEIGPYPASGAPAESAAASLSAVTRAFDLNVTSSTGDLWSAENGITSTFAPVYVPAGGSATITVKITPTGAAGSVESGTLFVDDVTLAGFIPSPVNPSGDELAAIPYHFTVSG
jgi:hypothetical protein